MKFKRFLQGFGILAIVLTLIPIVAADFWWIRMFDFPHIQLTILTFVALVSYFIKFDVKWWEDYVFVTIISACLVYQIAKISPYTAFAPFEVGKASEDVSKRDEIKFYSANVLQKNSKFDLLNDEIKRKDPDIILLMETDSIWMDQVKEAVSKYPYRVEAPIDNTYGMLLYSKLEMIEPQLRFLVDDSIPSIHTIIKMRSGKQFMFHAIHPTPPMPQENPSSADRDGEMMFVAKMARERKLPTIVAGDFNDVAWSSTSRLLKNAGRLLDVRIGRGFYNSFDAGSFLFRWPLDHFMVSEEFRVVDIKTGENIKSDHYPFFIQLSLEPELAEEQKPKPPTEGQLKRANEQIEDLLEEKAKKGENLGQ